MIEHISIETEAGTFDAIASGPEDGRPVLLLHGFPEAAIEWEHQVAVLGVNGFRAVAPDQRGYSPGVRPEQVSEYTVTHLVGDVIAMADALGWGTFDLVGHDWGGAVAWWTAIEHPDRLRTLSVFSTPHPGALKTALQTDEDQRLRSQYMLDWRERSTEKRMLENNPGALTAALNWYRAGNPHGAADKVSDKTMYVWSTEDVAFGSAAAFETEKWCTGGYRFEMVEEVSHWIPEEIPEAASSLLLEHLS